MNLGSLLRHRLDQTREPGAAMVVERRRVAVKMTVAPAEAARRHQIRHLVRQHFSQQLIEAGEIAVAMSRMQAPQVNEPIDRLQSGEGRQFSDKVQDTSLCALQLDACREFLGNTATVVGNQEFFTGQPRRARHGHINDYAAQMEACDRSGNGTRIVALDMGSGRRLRGARSRPQ
jgi:hypothetical protein